MIFLWQLRYWEIEPNKFPDTHYCFNLLLYKRTHLRIVLYTFLWKSQLYLTFHSICFSFHINVPWLEMPFIKIISTFRSRYRKMAFHDTIRLTKKMSIKYLTYLKETVSFHIFLYHISRTMPTFNIIWYHERLTEHAMI